MRDAPEAEVRHARVDHLRLPCRRPIAKAVVRRAQMRASLHDASWNRELWLAPIIARVRRGDARIRRRAAARLDDCIGVTRDEPIRGPLPDIARHVVQTEAV